jgi:hypothetical protein
MGRGPQRIVPVRDVGQPIRDLLRCGMLMGDQPPNNSGSNRAATPCASASARRRIVHALLLVVPLGFAAKFGLPSWLPGPVGRWSLLYGAAVCYEVFWVLVAALLAPRARSASIALGVLLATCLLEFLQLVHTPALDALRRTYWGAALLGNGFDWLDFPHYVIGCALGALLRQRLCRPSPAG